MFLYDDDNDDHDNSGCVDGSDDINDDIDSVDGVR